MSINTQLQDLVDVYKTQLETFNLKMKENFPTIEEITKIDTILRDATNQFDTYSNIMNERLDRLRNKTFCFIPSSISDSLGKLTLINFTSKIATFGGLILAAFGNHRPDLLWSGLGISFIGAAIDTGGQTYSTKLQLESQELNDLERFNNEVVANAKIFQLFIEKLKDVIEIESRIQKGNTDFADKIIVSLTGKISDCLNEYKKLPIKDQYIEINCRIASYFLQILPIDDQLHAGLTSLEPANPEDDIGLLAGKKLAVRYLPISSSGSESPGDSAGITSRRKWSAVEEGPYPLERSESVCLEDLLSPKPETKYAHQVFLLIQAFKDRFGLPNNINIPYLITRNGWKVSADPKLPLTKIESGEDIKISVDEEDCDLPNAADFTGEQKEDGEKLDSSDFQIEHRPVRNMAHTIFELGGSQYDMV